MTKTSESPRANWTSRWVRVRPRFWDAMSLSLAFKAMNFILVVPVVASILRYCLVRWGRPSVGNFESAAFLLSIEGLAALGCVGSIFLASFYLELAGLVRLLADERLCWWQAFTSSTRTFHRLVNLGFRQLVVYIVLATPFLVGVGFVYWWLWSDKDINGLIVLKPPIFWWGALLAACLVGVYGLLALRLSLRWIFAIPILTFEPGSTPALALRSSVDRSQVAFWRRVGVLSVWAVIQAVLTVCILGLVQWLSQFALGRHYDSLMLATIVAGLTLSTHAVVAALLSVFANVTLAELVLSFYRDVTPAALDTPEASRAPSTIDTSATSTTSISAGDKRGWRLAVILALLMLAACVTGYWTLNHSKLPTPLEVTAHRAGGAHAPENTLVALKLAIADRADWAEIDVQRTADEALVVMHDSDLARVGGGHRKVEQVTLSEIQALDVGVLFGKEFANERIAILSAFLDAAKDRIRLNVELKPHGKVDAEPLTRSVLAEIQRSGMVDQCRICSQSYESLQLVRQLEPRIPVGFIVGAAIGDPTDLDVDFLMVKGSLATRKLVDRARLRNISVHAWTINDPKDVAPLVDAGVDNIITDDPALIRKRLDEILELGTVERLLLQVRSTIAR